MSRRGWSWRDGRLQTVSAWSHSPPFPRCRSTRSSRLIWPGLAEVVASHRAIVVTEEMSPQRSLGMKSERSPTSDTLAHEFIDLPLPDKFVHIYGTHEDAVAAHGLTADHIISGISKT